MLKCINIQISAIPFNFRKFSLYNPVEVFFMPIITRCRLLYLDEIHLTSPPSLKTEITAIPAPPPPLKNLEDMVCIFKVISIHPQLKNGLKILPYPTPQKIRV